MFGDQQDEKDKEEEFMMPPLKNFQFTFQIEKVIECKTLYIAFYGIQSIYVSSMVDTKIPIGRINFQKAKQKSLGSVYIDSNKNECFMIFNEQFEKMMEIYLADFITKYFKFTELVIVSSVARNTLEKDDGGLLQCLQTSWGNRVTIPRYCEGITGVGVDLMQWAEINGRNAIWFVGIYSDYEVRKETVEDIFGGLNNLYPVQCKYDISKQIKAYNMAKYANKLYL